jgi:hypothetical protein
LKVDAEGGEKYLTELEYIDNAFAVGLELHYGLPGGYELPTFKQCMELAAKVAEHHKVIMFKGNMWATEMVGVK